MGSSGGGGGSYPTAEEASAFLREAKDESRAAGHDAEVNELLAEVLKEANQRASDKIAQHIETIEKALANELEDTIELRFGGSVQKHTYVDGLSDVDMLAIVRRQVAEKTSPKDLIQSFAAGIHSRLPYTYVEPGDLSIKVEFSDGIQIQVLPAFKTQTGFRIARRFGATWSGVIRPREFASQLTNINQQNGGNVVRVIKIMKIVQESLPANARLSGYHIENIALDAFRSYQGRLALRDMFLHLARTAATRVKEPVHETTGQSAYVDDYLGPAGSEERNRASASLNRMVNQLEEADRNNRITPWKARF